MLQTLEDPSPVRMLRRCPPAEHGPAALMHKKEKGGVRDLRKVEGNRMKPKGGAGGAGVNRNRLKTVAERAAPASYLGGLGARWRGRRWGNGRGELGLLIGTKMEGNRGLNHRIEGRCVSSGEPRDSWREEEEGDVIADALAALTGGSHLSVAEKEKKGKGARSVVLTGWRACGAAGLAQLG